MNAKRGVMTKKLTEEDVKTINMVDVMKMYDFALRCLQNVHMPHDRETLRHNERVLRPKYEAFMEYLDE